MGDRLSVRAASLGLGFSLAIGYALCVLFDLVFPGYAMYRAWAILLPGFKWINFESFLIGLVETFLYGALFAALFVAIYNRCLVRETSIERAA